MRSWCLRENIKTKKNHFAKSYTSYWFEEVFVIKRIKNIVQVISHLNGEEIVEIFYEKELQKRIQD